RAGALPRQEGATAAAHLPQERLIAPYRRGRYPRVAAPPMSGPSRLRRRCPSALGGIPAASRIRLAVLRGGGHQGLPVGAVDAADMDIHLVEGDLDIVLAEQLVDAPVDLVDGGIAVHQFPHMDPQFVVE